VRRPLFYKSIGVRVRESLITLDKIIDWLPNLDEP
jgi:hypothetical protein